MPPLRISAILFDFDGTLVDAMPGFSRTAVELICANYAGVFEDEARRRYLQTAGMDFASQLEAIFPGHPANAGVASDFERIKQESMLSHPLFPEAANTLERLSNTGFPLFICSSTLHELIARYAAAKNIAIYFREILGYQILPGREDDADSGAAAGRGKAVEILDKGRQIQRVCARYELLPERVLFVGDTLADFRFARDCGVAFLGLAGLCSPADFRHAGADCVESLAALPDRIQFPAAANSVERKLSP